MMPEPISRLARLRAGTRELHARIETVPALARLLAADLTQNEYVSILQHLHAFHAHVEPAVAAELEGKPAAAMLDGARPRALAEDLAWFGEAMLTPPCLPALAGPAAALGALYVIEGSGLGGRVIARHLTDSLGVSAGAGGSFYCRLDAETARHRWHCLVALLEDAEVDADAMVAGASAIFGCLEQWLRTIETVPGTTKVAAVAETVAP